MSTPRSRAGRTHRDQPHRAARGGGPMVLGCVAAAALIATARIFGQDACDLWGRRSQLDPSGLLRLLSDAAVAVLAGWLAAVCVGHVATRLPGRVGRLGAAVARGLAPAAVRRVLALCLVAAATGPGVAHAATEPTGPAATAHLTGPGRGPDAIGPAGGRPPGADGLPDPRLRPDRGAAEPGRDVASSIVVRPGDTLWDLAAAELGPQATPDRIARAWPQWYAANRPPLANPHLIYAGQTLTVPPGPPQNQPTPR